MDPLTLVARLLNALVSPIAKWASGRLELSNARAKHDMKREWKAQERRDEFQRETLSEVQGLLFDLGRVAGYLQHRDRALFKETGQWGLARTGEEEGERIRLAIVRLNKLTVLIEDEPLRGSLEQFLVELDSVTIAKSEEQSERVMKKTMAALRTSNARVGEILRALISGQAAAKTAKLQERRPVSTDDQPDRAARR